MFLSNNALTHMQALLMAKIWFRNDNHAVWAVVMWIVNCTIITNVKVLARYNLYCRIGAILSRCPFWSTNHSYTSQQTASTEPWVESPYHTGCCGIVSPRTMLRLVQCWPTALALWNRKGVSRCEWWAATAFMLAVHVCNVCEGRRRETEQPCAYCLMS